MFESRLDAGYKSFVKEDEGIADTDGHGTHVAGIIADGTSRHIKILPVKVLSKEGKGGFVEVINGIYYAIEQGADVINLSLAINLDDYGNYWADAAVAKEEAALKKAEECDCLCVAAAGNDSRNLDILKVYPAISEHTITVSSVNSNLTRAASSNYGESVDFAAPGDLISSASAEGKDRYCIKSGTSMAAPHISAACAMLRLYNRTATTAEIKELLLKCTVDIGDPGKDKKYGNGLVTFKDGIVPVVSAKPTEGSGEKGEEKPKEEEHKQEKKETKKEDTKKEETKKEEKKKQETKKTTVIKPKGTAFKKMTKSKTSLKLVWKKQTAKVSKKRITGYQIQYSTNKTFSKNKKTISFKGYKKTSGVIKKLTRKKRYYLRIRTYLKIGKKTYYSAWSKTKTIKL